MSVYSLLTKESKEEQLLKGIDHVVTIDDQFSSTKTTFRYKNELENPVEMEYHFPKSISTSIYNVEVLMKDPETGESLKLIADVEEKEIADEKYDDGIASGNTAMVMKHSNTNPQSCVLFLGNVPPKHEINVVFDKVERMKIEGKLDDSGKVTTVLSHIIPTMKERNQVVVGSPSKVMDVRYIIKHPEVGEILKISSSSHGEEILSFSKSKGETHVSLKEKISMIRNFSLDILMKDYPLCSWYYSKNSETLQSHVVSFFPQFNLEKEKKQNLEELIILVDRSGSMSGKRMALTKEALKLVLYSLDVEDKLLFNIVSFGSTFSSLFPTSVQFDEKTFETALVYCSKMKADFGGTNMYGPLSTILTENRKQGYKRSIFLLTDGEDDNPQNTMDFVYSQAEASRIYSFGIGCGINPHFLTELSRITKGRSVFIEDNNKIEELVIDQLERCLQHTITNLKISFLKDCVKKYYDVGQQNQIDDGDQRNELGTRLEDIDILNFELTSKYFLSQNIVAELEKEEVEIQFSCGKESEKYKVHAIENSLIGYFCGQKRVENLEGRIQKFKNFKKFRYRELPNAQKTMKVLKEEIGKIGKLFKLLTSQTSFVMVAENEVRVDKELIHKVIPSIIFENMEKEYLNVTQRLEDVLAKREVEIRERENRILRKKEEEEKLKFQKIIEEEEKKNLQPPVPVPNHPVQKLVVTKPISGPISSEREKYVYLSKISEQCERYEDMYKNCCKLIDHAKSELTIEEINLFSVSMKNLIGVRRASWRVVSAKEKSDFSAISSDGEEKLKKIVVDYRKKLEGEILGKSDHMLGYIQKLVSCNSSSDEYLTCMHKLVGDYYRYQCEIYKAEIDDQKKMSKDGKAEVGLQKKFDEVVEKAKNAYKTSGTHAQKLPPTTPIRLGLKLNLSVFCFEILDDPKLACKIAKGSFEDAIEELDSLSEEEYKDSTLIMQLLKDNLTLWTEDDEEIDDIDEDEFEDFDEPDMDVAEPEPEPELIQEPEELENSEPNKPSEKKKNPNEKVSGKQDVSRRIKLNDLLFCASVLGIFKAEEKVSKLMLYNLKKIEEACPKLEKSVDSAKYSIMDLWITSIILVLLERYFTSVQVKWRMIAKKSRKILTKVGIFDELLNEARKFVDMN